LTDDREGVFEPAPSSSAALASGSPELVRVLLGLPPAHTGMHVWGPAFTVRGRAGDNLALHRALALATKRDVLVVSLDGDTKKGHWGELMTIAAQVAGLAGLVIDGPIRDTAAIAERGFPVFHRGTHPSPATKTDPGEIQVPIAVDGVEIGPGDGVFADDDGIVIVPAEHLAAAVEAASRVEAREQRIAAQLLRGESTMRVLGLDGLGIPAGKTGKDPD
jgi:4-hydroxy-4-methyl-2-oxoglutarate aldolase